MPSNIYWIDTPARGRLAIMARPRAGDWLTDEVDVWQRSGIDAVFSLLERDEIDELGLADEPDACVRHGIAFAAFPIPDRGVPQDMREAVAIAQRIAMDLEGGKCIAIHCRAGIGRSSLMAACALVCMGVLPDAAIDAIGTARGLSVPDTPAQHAWVRAFNPASTG
jgi:protein-tyrosine phosphatase